MSDKRKATHQLLLLRHAKSSRNIPSTPDHERPLSKRGRNAAQVMGRVMRSEDLVPDLVLVSTARRAMETLEALEPWAEQPILDAKKALYLASAPSMLDLLRNLKETAQSVLLIGHNPGLHALAVLLVGAHSKAAERKLAKRLAKSYPSGTLAEFALACPWSQIEEGSGRLVRFVTPRELKALA